MSEIIDTHAHVYSDEFDVDRIDMLQRAKKAGVIKILMPAIDSHSHAAMFDLEKTHQGYCLAMMGLHPCYVKENVAEELSIVENLLRTRSFIGVGEIGLDYYWDLTYKEQQLEAFRKQVQWSKELRLPVSIHSRNATADAIEVIEEMQDGNASGVFHCFSGTVEEAKRITGAGFYLGIGGVVSFKNGGLDKVVAEIGLDKIVLETDAPYLAPMPFRGKRNEPGYLKIVAEKISSVTKVAQEEVARITTANAKEIFKL